MAYNKSKHVEAAQKLLNQGKVAQAIAEYQQILKYESRDQVTLMTIGELYIRQGETFQAIDYFERLAQLFVGDGFLTKAIAVYKRIAKLAPEEIRPLEKLADLYVQQGVMSEARPLFLQLAEIHLKNNRQPEAVALLKKLLMAEPDNLRIQIRLADLYQAMGQNNEAIETYISAAQRAVARGDQGECEKLADKALKLDPHNLAAVIVKARIYSSQGNLTQAAQALEKVADLEKGGEQTELLLDLYLKNQNWEEAAALAQRVFDADEKNFGPMQKVVEALLESGQGERAMAILEKSRTPMIDAGEHEVVGRLLTELATSMPGKIEPLEWLVDMYGRTSDSFRLPDALAQLGDALTAGKQYDKAKQIFEQLADRQPESDTAKRKLNDLLRKMGLLAPEAAAEPAAARETLQADLEKPAAPKVQPDMPPAADTEVEVEAKPAMVSQEVALDDDTQKFIAQSLTDVDLFASYGLTQKAIGLLEAILRRAPRHTPTLEKLLDFVLGAGDDRRTAELAAQLECIHQERGDARSAERFGELRRRYQRAAGLSDEDLAAFTAPAVATSAAVPVVGAESTASEASAEASEDTVAKAPAPEAEKVHEVDLSDEWATMLEGTQAAETPASAAAPASEVHAQASAAANDGAEEFTISEEPAAATETESQAYTEFEVPIEASVTEEKELAEVSGEATPVDAAPVAAAEAIEIRIPQDEAKKAEPEFELEQDYELILDPEPLVPAHEQKPPETPVAETAGHDGAKREGGGFASDKFLADLASEIDQLGMDSLSPSFSEPAPAAGKNAAKGEQQAANPAESGPLKEVFEEFRAELGEMGAEDEDLETHYNLGIAFREMGLLEEAISEFQKVAKATDHGRPFRYTMQCCTLLGLAFMEKGQPGIAAIWYERALRTPDLEPESILALRYDLGVAQESAGEADGALKSFSKVYAMNIDYRDVAERIAALQKTSR